MIWPATGIYESFRDVSAIDILDLEVTPEADLPQHTTTEHGHKRSTASELSVPVASYASEPSEAGRPSPISSVRHLPPVVTLIDPAIVGFRQLEASPVEASTVISPKAQDPVSQAPPIPQHLLVEAARGSPTRATPTIPFRRETQALTKPTKTADAEIINVQRLTKSTLKETHDDSMTGSNAEDVGSHAVAAELGTHDRNGDMAHMDESILYGASKTGKKTRRGAKGKSSKNGLNSLLASQNTSAPLDEDVDKKNKPSRQRTVLAEADSLGISLPTQSSKNKRTTRRDRLKPKETQNGWATEDATDIQELGDFDFAGNLSKFNKREVFKQLKSEDTIADELRLVNHNRLPRAGTAGGRNLPLDRECP